MLSNRFFSPSFPRFAVLPLLILALTVSSFAQEIEPVTNEQNPVEQLPSAPDSGNAESKNAGTDNSPAPRETPARAKNDAAENSVAARTGSTPSAPGALMPDAGWEILDAPRQIPASPQNDSPPLPTANESLRAIITRMNLALPLSQGRIVIDKSERRLDLYNGNNLVKSYGVALGKNPSGHKIREGDNRTPEGDFYICTRNAKNSAFHIFLGLSYPALPDAKRAADSKQITWREYQIIHQRLASRGRPPWETNLGGWVGIHGGTDANFAQKKMRERGTRDWTAGCIALTNREIEELHAATRLGTPVRVQP